MTTGTKEPKPKDTRPTNKNRHKATTITCDSCFYYQRLGGVVKAHAYGGER